MADTTHEMLGKLRTLVDAAVCALAGCRDEDLDKTVSFEFDGTRYEGPLKVLVRYVIEEFVAHRGQIAGNQYLIDAANQTRAGSTVTLPTCYMRNEGKRLAADLLLAATGLVAQLIGYPEEHWDDRPREGEWSIRQILQHCIDMEESKTFSLQEFVKQAQR